GVIIYLTFGCMPRPSLQKLFTMRMIGTSAMEYAAVVANAIDSAPSRCQSDTMPSKAAAHMHQIIALPHVYPILRAPCQYNRTKTCIGAANIMISTIVVP